MLDIFKDDPLKNISIIHNGVERKLQYRVVSRHEEYYGNYYVTKFYEGTITHSYKKYLFFGKVIIKTEPKLIFTRYLNIESNEYTKKEIANLLHLNLDKVDRKIEIEKGEIV